MVIEVEGQRWLRDDDAATHNDNENNVDNDDDYEEDEGVKGMR